jgi:membrane protein DedA with SNARE-associated domain
MRAQIMILLLHYGYLAVFLLIMLEDFGLPAPGETALIVASIAAAAGKLNIWGVLAAAFFGALVGDNIGWLIGRYGGRKLVIRVGSRVGLTESRFETAETTFCRYGDVIVVGARFVEILRQFNGIIAGTMGMHWAKFLAYNALGAALWVGTWAAVGYFAGGHIRQIEHWFIRFSWLALLLVGAGVLWWAIKSRQPAAPADGV